jgi:hypothetical protein
LQLFLRVIPIGVPTSNRRPTSPIHFNLFFTALPSILKLKRYPACVLDLNKSENLSRRKSVTLLTHFIPLSWFILVDHTRPIELFVSQTLKKRGLIFYIKFCLNNLFVRISKNFTFEYRVSFITFKFQMFYKVMFFIFKKQVSVDFFLVIFYKNFSSSVKFSSHTCKDFI